MAFVGDSRSIEWNGNHGEAKRLCRAGAASICLVGGLCKTVDWAANMGA